MKSAIAAYALFAGLLILNPVFAQKYVVRDIRSFGAKGDGKRDDQPAFEKAAAYFNKRGGNGKLTISKGVYMVGKQTFTGGTNGKPAYEGITVLSFSGVKNLKVTGAAGAIVRFRDSLRFGAFIPATGMPYDHGTNNFTDYSYAAFIGMCIYFEKCSNISVSNLVLDGNNKGMVMGGFWGDVGRQLAHSGVYIKNSNNVTVDNINAHHFGLDGICVANAASAKADGIIISNSTFEYNARQGLSWIGGNSLVTRNCRFNNTGKAFFSSPPAAGVDIEAEVGPVRNGNFIGCEFINNTGVGLLADAGDEADCVFRNCLFWGTTNWSLWITKPGFTFNGCNIYGSPVHGYSASDEKDATKFISCNFEDKPYKGKEPFGNLLIESNNAKRMSFSNCRFTANRKKLCWISIDPATRQEEKYQFTNCSFVIRNKDDSPGDVIGLIKGMALKNCTFSFQNPKDRNKAPYQINFKEGANVDLGGNKIKYSPE